MSGSKCATVLSLYFAFLLDNVLLTVVVPIIPDFLSAGRGATAPKSLSDLQLEYEELDKENGPVGVLFSSKALLQLLANPLVGYATSVFGYSIPLLVGSVNLLVASLLFAYGQSYPCLLLARSLHGTASACIAVSGMSLAAGLYDGPARSKLMGLVLGGGALGVFFGYPLGGILYDLLGKTAPFVLIATLACLCAVLQALSLDVRPGANVRAEPEDSATGDWRVLLLDSRVAVASGAIWLSTSAMAILEPCLPLWLMAHLSPPPHKWQLGAVFIPDSLGYLVGTNFTGILAGNLARWKLGVVSMITIGLSSVLLPSASSVTGLILPHLGIGLGIGVLDASFVPLLSEVAESRHACYGSVYAIQQTAVSLAYSVGPLLGGEAVKLVGFPWLMRTIGILNLALCPLVLLLADSAGAPAHLLPQRGAFYSTAIQMDERTARTYQRFHDDDDDDDNDDDDQDDDHDEGEAAAAAAAAETAVAVANDVPE